MRSVEEIQADDRLWTVKDVAHYLSASRSLVYQKAEGGKLPCLRIGGLLRFEPEVIRAYARGEQKMATVRPIKTKANKKDVHKKEESDNEGTA